MGGIERFEDLEIWRRARGLVNAIYLLSRKSELSKDFILRDQALRSALSIMSNIAEGFERGGTKEFIQFLSVAKGSSGELRSQLYVIRDQQYCPADELDALQSDVLETSKMISGMIRYLRQSPLKGPKFK